MYNILFNTKNYHYYKLYSLNIILYIYIYIYIFTVYTILNKNLFYILISLFKEITINISRLLLIFVLYFG